MNEALHANQNQNAGADEYCGLGKFHRNNPPTFKGRYDLESAQAMHRCKILVRGYSPEDGSC